MNFVAVGTKRVRRRDKRAWFMGLAVFTAVFSFVFLEQRFKGSDDVEAANLANFDAGYIISDYQMGNYNSMSEAEIQAFLTAKNSCDNSDYGYYQRLSGNYNYRWHFENGHFVCLSEERFGDGDNEIGFQYGESAAHIIWQAAQDYKINPQVLIVLLQKETGLITDKIPNNGDYRKATGYGCPDTAACSSEYYGFKNQVRNAASLYRYVLDNGSRYYPTGNTYVQYNPNAGCGGSVINIRNRATSALYQYTPYQPNGAALAAGYGAGDGCSAYGNRNFYSYFEDWFGEATIEKNRTDVFIMEGDYEIVSLLSRDKVLDVASDGNVQLYNRNYSDAQKWHVSRNSDGTYSIVNVGTGKGLDVLGGSSSSEANVQVYSKNTTCAQKWKIEADSNNINTILSSCSKMALDIQGADSSNGANIQVYYDNYSLAQEWTLRPVRSIADGLYNISVSSSEKAVFDIAGGVAGAGNNTNIQLYDRNNTKAQQWYVRYDTDGYYSIINPATNRLVSVVNSNIQLHTYNGTCGQRWQIMDDKKGGYEIVVPCSGSRISLAENNVNNGNNIVAVTKSNKQLSSWKFEPADFVIGESYEIVVSADDRRALDISGGASGARNGTNIQLYGRNGTDAQKWYIKNGTNGAYIIINPATGKVLDALDAGIINGTNIQLYDYNGSCAQQWKIERNNDGSYSFSSACSKLVLDVKEGFIADGSNIQLYSSNSSAAQKWKFVQ